MINQNIVNQTFSGQDISVVAFNTNRLNEELKARDLENKILKQSSGKLSTDFFSSNYTGTGGENYLPIPRHDRDTSNQGHSNIVQNLANSEKRAYESALKSERQKEESLHCSAKTSGNKLFYEIGNLDSISYSTFREKVAVRSLGRSHAMGYTRGARTIAGSMTFNVLHKDMFLDFFRNESLSGENNPMMLDQIPPFNLVLFFANEYGISSMLHIFNVELASESQRMSVHDIVVQNSINFYATDIIPMQEVGQEYSSYLDMHNRGYLQTQFMKQLQKNASCSNIHHYNKKRVDNLLDINNPNSEINKLLQRSRGL